MLPNMALKEHLQAHLSSGQTNPGAEGEADADPTAPEGEVIEDSDVPEGGVDGAPENPTAAVESSTEATPRTPSTKAEPSKVNKSSSQSSGLKPTGVHLSKYSGLSQRRPFIGS